MCLFRQRSSFEFEGSNKKRLIQTIRRRPLFLYLLQRSNARSGIRFGGAHCTRRMFFKQKLCFLSTGFLLWLTEMWSNAERERESERKRNKGRERRALHWSISLPVSHTPIRSSVRHAGVMALDVRFTSRFAVRYYDPRQFSFPSKRLRECTESIMLSACAHLKDSLHSTEK